jgi:hypothetical protein
VIDQWQGENQPVDNVNQAYHDQDNETGNVKNMSKVLRCHIKEKCIDKK